MTRYKYSAGFFLLIIILIAEVKSEDRLFFSGIGLNYNIDFSKPRKNSNELIGDLQFGYTSPNQQSEITLHFALDFFNGFEQDRSIIENDNIEIFSDSSIGQISKFYFNKQKTFNFQVFLSSDLYLGNYFIRIQPRFHFDFTSHSDSAAETLSRYNSGIFIPYDTLTYGNSDHFEFGFYPGFSVGIGYKWKNIKLLIYNANVVSIGICIDYTFDVITRKKTHDIYSNKYN